MDDRTMSFTEHLAELRTRLLRSLLAVAAGFAVAWAFHVELFQALARPVMAGLRNHGIYAIQALQVTETIGVYLEVSLIAGAVLAGPVVLYQIWAFVAPGLYPDERRHVVPVVGLVSAFFILGVVFAYFVFMPMVIDYLVGFTMEGGAIELVPTVERTFSISITFLVLFGLVFELPLLLFFLALLRVVDHRKLLKFGRYFIVLAFVVAAVLTPPEPLSQVLMAIPLSVLYFVGVAFAWVAVRLRSGGTRAVTRIVGGGVFAAFALSIVLAAWLWTTAGRVAWADSVPSSASYALRADLASPLGRAAAGREAGAPAADEPSTLLSCGPDAPGVPPALSELDDESDPVVLAAGETCATALLPAGLGPVSGLTMRARGAPRSIAVVSVVVRADEATVGRIASWVRAIAEASARPSRAPLDRALSMAAGDIEVTGAAGQARIDIVVPGPRASRIVATIARDLAQACGSGQCGEVP